MFRSGLSRRGVLALSGLTLVTGCSSADDLGLPDRLERIRPTDLPTPALTPRPTEPLDSRRVQGPRFALWIPSAWSDRELPSRQGARLFAYDATGRSPERPVRVGVVVEDPAAADSIEQSQVLVAEMTAAGKQEIRRSLISWPQARYAVLVDWVETPGGGADRPFRTRQLMVQVSDRVIVNVLAVAPAEEFEDLRLDDIMGTLTIEP